MRSDIDDFEYVIDCIIGILTMILTILVGVAGVYAIITLTEDVDFLTKFCIITITAICDVMLVVKCFKHF